ncbi:MAG: hypothetical protein ACRET7_09630 [Burkholderiales bacterium]
MNASVAASERGDRRVEGELPGCDDTERRGGADDLKGRRRDRAQSVGPSDLPSGGGEQRRRGRRGLHDSVQTHKPN